MILPRRHGLDGLVEPWQGDWGVLGMLTGAQTMRARLISEYNSDWV